MRRFRVEGTGWASGEKIISVVTVANTPQGAVNRARLMYSMIVLNVYLWKDKEEKYVLCSNKFWE